MSTNKKREYSFNGTFDYSSVPGSADVSGNISPKRNGFFKGSLVDGKDRYDIVGHLNKTKDIAHMLFVVTPIKGVNQHCIYSVSNPNAPNFEGEYIGGWYLTFEELTPQIVQDYHSLLKYASRAGSIDGCVSLNLNLDTIDSKVAKRA